MQRLRREDASEEIELDVEGARIKKHVKARIKRHFYDRDFGEYDAWLNIREMGSIEELQLEIEKKFKLPEYSAAELAKQLWHVYEGKLIVPDDRVIPVYYGLDRLDQGFYFKRGRDNNFYMFRKGGRGLVTWSKGNYEAAQERGRKRMRTVLMGVV